MTFDDEARARLAREWMRSPMKQSEFCAAHGISTRVLREWVRRFGVGDRPEARAVAIIDDAIERLRALRDAVVAEEARQDGTADEPEPEATETHAPRHAESERPSSAEDARAAPAADPVKPIPMPSPGFPWF